MNKRSYHPYEPFIPSKATKIIIGSIPPYRFCIKPQILKHNDVNFYYGSCKNYFWSLLANITGTSLTFLNNEEAIKERKKLLKQLNIGITDVIASCLHDKEKSDDNSLKDIKYQDISKILAQYPTITTIICTSEFVKKHLNKLASKKYQPSKENKRKGKIEFNKKVYEVIILYSPSPLALRNLGVNGFQKRQEQYLEVFKR